MNTHAPANEKRNLDKKPPDVRMEKPRLKNRRRGHIPGMPKRSSKQKDIQQLARSVLDAIVPDAEPAAAKPEKNPIMKAGLR